MDSEEVVLIGLLKGSIISFAQLIKDVRINCVIDFITVSSYLSTSSTGKVLIKQNFDVDIRGKDVLLFDDILDTGLTLKKICEHLKESGPKSVRTMVLLEKNVERKRDIKVDIAGFRVPNYFVLGYGFDLDGYFRNWDYIASITE